MVAGAIIRDAARSGSGRMAAVLAMALALPAVVGCRVGEVSTMEDCRVMATPPVYDAESVYADYPPSYNLLRDAAGRPITTAEAWEKRRPEILQTMLREVYGFAPPPVAPTFAVLRSDDQALGGAARLRQVEIGLARTVAGVEKKMSFKLTLFLPASVAGPVPVFLLLNNRSPKLIDPNRTEWNGFWPVDAGLARGYGMAAVQVQEIDPDKDDGFVNGVHALFDAPRGPDAWGTLAAWAWGAGRCLDYLRSDPAVDGERVAVAGHSRGGKAALLAAATDPRFALAVSNDSGCGGAALSRRARGETIEKINQNFPYWFNDHFKRYNGRDHDLPFDQHFLVASIAPRAVYHASAAEDTWADPEGEFATLRLAEPVYRLYGLGGIGTDWPGLDQPRLGRNMGYHIRPGGHDLLRSDWNRFFDFAQYSLSPTGRGSVRRR